MTILQNKETKEVIYYYETLSDAYYAKLLHEYLDNTEYEVILP